MGTSTTLAGDRGTDTVVSGIVGFSEMMKSDPTMIDQCYFDPLLAGVLSSLGSTPWPTELGRPDLRGAIDLALVEVCTQEREADLKKCVCVCGASVQPCYVQQGDGTGLQSSIKPSSPQ